MKSRIAAIGVVLAAAACTVDQPRPSGAGAVISGRIVDPQGLMTSDALLHVGAVTSPTEISFRPAIIHPDKTFVTPALAPATYLLELVRTPHSRTHPATPIALTTVTLGATDIDNVALEVKPDVEIHGRFRVEPPSAEWPTHAHVTSRLVLGDGREVLTTTLYEGLPGGRFILRNAFGPRLLDVGLGVRPGGKFRGGNHRVLLDGADITTVPTDFSSKPGSRLEIVFFQD